MFDFDQALLRSIRDYQRHAARTGNISKIRRRIARLRHVFWSVITSSDIDPHVRFGDGLKLPHPTGVVFHGGAVIGINCMIMQQVTLGMIGAGEYPTVGDNVYIGAGAKIIGRVRIGDGARIGAGAVVLADVPAGFTAVGNPARLVQKTTPPGSQRDCR
jgi:serine O-acetyltransferase